MYAEVANKTINLGIINESEFTHGVRAQVTINAEMLRSKYESLVIFFKFCPDFR